MDTGKKGWLAGSTSTVRSGLYTREKTFRRGLEKDVEVYCIREFKPGSPQAQVGAAFFMRGTAAIAVTRTTTEAANHGMSVEMDVTSSANAAPGRNCCTVALSGFKSNPGKAPMTVQAAARR